MKIKYKLKAAFMVAFSILALLGTTSAASAGGHVDLSDIDGSKWGFLY